MKVLLVVFVFLKITSIIAQSYNKSELLELYPELGKDFVMIPDDSGEVRVGYLSHPGESNEKNNQSSLRVESRILGILHHNINKDITFTLYTRNHPEGNSINEFDHLADYFDETKKTKFIVHGWMGTGTSNVCVNIKNGFLNTSDVNVFIVDWSPIAGNRFYPIPMRATSDVGEHYGNFLKYLVDNRGTNPKDIHLIGHSLGAHVSGFAGRGLKDNKVARITGLDPAAPGFDWPLVEGGRLNKNDADFVDVIHTCAGFLGMKDPIGHADFYPNGGGPPQPGCNILEFFEACSHSRSWQLFAESIVLEEPFMATECESLSLLESSQCKGDEVPMGIQTPLWANGIYYLKTTGEEPFLQVNDEKQ